MNYYFHFQVAIKIIDKSQLDPSNLAKASNIFMKHDENFHQDNNDKKSLFIVHNIHVNNSDYIIMVFQVYREVDVMKLVSHPNIVKLYQVKSQYTNTYKRYMILKYSEMLLIL